MSSKNKRQRKSNVNLFFNQQINIFPEDFFSTYDKKSNFNIEKSRNIPHPKIILPKFKENPKTNSFVNARNINKNNEEIAKTNFTNVIKLDNINNLDFSFQAPVPPDKTPKLNNKNRSMTKNNSFQPLFRSPFNNKLKKYDYVNRSSQSQSSAKNSNIINNIANKNTKPYKYKYRNIKCNELFKETKLKFLKNKYISNLSTYNHKEKDKDKIGSEDENGKENEIPKNINTNLTSKKNDNKKTKYYNYRISTPVIKNRVIKKILNINRSKEIVLRTNSLKAFNNKNIEPEKKIKNKPKEIALKSSSLKLINNKKANSIIETEKKIKNKTKILENINNFNNRALSSKNYNKEKNFLKNNSKINRTQNSANSKNNMKKNIKNTIDKIFKEMPKDYENNPVLIYKFNSLIRNMKNFQHIIQSKKNSFCKDKNFDEKKNNDIENGI